MRDPSLQLPSPVESNADIELKDVSERVLQGKIDDNGDIVDGAKIDGLYLISYPRSIHLNSITLASQIIIISYISE